MAKRAQASRAKKRVKKRTPAASDAELRLKAANAKLRRELKAAHERQIATAEILKVIASSPSDLQPVFDAIADRSNRLIGGHSTAVFRFIDDTVELAAFTSVDAEADAALRASFPLPLAEFTDFESVRKGGTVQRTDTEAHGIPSRLRDLARSRGYRSILLTSLVTDQGPIGTINVTRKEPGAFAAHHVQLLQTFADQAVIAIQNVKLFEEVQAKTRDLEESLQQQTATADVLKVISRSAFDLDSVLSTLVASAAKLCEAERGLIFLREANDFCMAANFGFSAELEEFARTHPLPANGASTTARAAASGVPVQAVDLLADSTQGDLAREYQRLGGHRTNLGVPLRREGDTIGVFTLTRQVVRPFTERQISLVQTFADQAVIAIENARLFDEVQAKTRDLTEALTYQTGSSNILKVIASSPTDVAPVLNAIVESACELCEANDAVVLLKDGDHLRFSAHFGPIAINMERWPINRNWSAGRAFVDQKPVHVRDMLSDEGTEFPDGRQLSRHAGIEIRSILSVPLLRENESIGSILLRRTEMHPFSDKQIGLLQTFADQAVIAIGNVRLFDEVQAKTRDLEESLVYQTGSANILKVIASSTTDVAPVLKAIVDSAAEICDAIDAVVVLKEGSDLWFRAHHGDIPLVFEKWPITPRWTAGRAFLEQRPVHVHDLLSAEGEEFPEGRELATQMGHRTILSVPMLRENESIGAIVLRRTEVQPFTDKQIDLLKTFADQAVIAIENVRLFDEVQAKTHDLEEALQFQTASAEVLKVISRSPDALQPVLDVIVTTSRELCSAISSVIFLFRDGKFQVAAEANPQAEYINFVRSNPILPNQVGSALARAARERRTVHVPNTAEDPEYGLGGPLDSGRPRALLSVPLIHEGRVIGGISLGQSLLTPFTSRQIEAVETFADQAVIAISNVNLFEQVQQRTRELSQSLDDLRSAQDRLVQTEKLASLGQLTAGIAHEIKNPLNFVNNFSALSAELVDEMNDVLVGAQLEANKREELDEIRGLLKSNLEKVVEHGKRADSIVKNMLLHSRSGAGEHREVDVNAVIDESVNLAYHGARAEKPGFNITLERDFDPAAGVADIYPQEITRVFLNLISNGFYAAARRATEAGDGFAPVLKAMTRNLGDSVEVRIRDNGTGIPPDIKDKIFNPFFTTKPAGEGTGLGLSMSHDIIVKQHGGTIDVITEPGAFTEFIITLPRRALAQAEVGERRN